MKLSSPIGRRRARIEIIPLIDIMFFLLASFMMVSLQLDQSRNAKVNLPVASESTHDFKPDRFSIAVDRSGSVWVEKRKLTLPDLGQVLSNRYRLNANLPVHLSGDQDTLQGAMADVLEVVRAAGVQKIAFTVQTAQEPAAGKLP